MSSFKKCLWILCTILFLFLSERATAQTIPVGSILDEQLKLQTLLSDSLGFAPVNRPLSANSYHSLLTENRNTSKWWEKNLLRKKIFSSDILDIGLLPIFVQNTSNTRFPVGENNAAAWYGRGFTPEFMGGFYLTSKYVTLNIYPHLIYQENVDFLTPRFIPKDSHGNIRYVAQGIGNSIDRPFRFGPDPFTTIDPGNSSIRLHYKKLETGLSTEPLWWGPAIRYPLVFSNNAPGFPHFFFASREPIKIPYFGNIQFQWILGYPQDSKYYDGKGAGNTRFMNAINFAYNPPFFDQLTLGFIRVFQMYEVGGFDFNNALLIVKPGGQDYVDPNQGGDVTQDRNQTASIYVHLALPEANGEIYGEFYREDRSYNLRDFINEPNHNSAYSFGFQKISYAPWVDFVKTNLEFTNLTESQLRQVRPQTYIYTHSKIRQGHTNKGQLLGAAIGPGSNSQYLSIDAYKDEFKFGIFAQRWVDNDNFHFVHGSASLSPSEQFGDYFRHRVNLNFGLNFLYGPGPFYLTSRLMWTKAYNYGRFDYGNFDGVNVGNYEHFDRINIQFQLGITYIL